MSYCCGGRSLIEICGLMRTNNCGIRNHGMRNSAEELSVSFLLITFVWQVSSHHSAMSLLYLTWVTPCTINRTWVTPCAINRRWATALYPLLTYLCDVVDISMLQCVMKVWSFFTTFYWSGHNKTAMCRTIHLVLSCVDRPSRTHRS